MAYLLQDDRWHYLGQVQSNRDGEPLFLHRSMSAKFLPDQDLDENYKVTFITSPVGKESYTRYHYMKADDRGIIRVLDSTHGQTELKCSDLDAKTVAILHRRNPDRCAFFFPYSEVNAPRLTCCAANHRVAARITIKKKKTIVRGRPSWVGAVLITARFAVAG